VRRGCSLRRSRFDVFFPGRRRLSQLGQIVVDMHFVGHRHFRVVIVDRERHEVLPAFDILGADDFALHADGHAGLLNVDTDHYFLVDEESRDPDHDHLRSRKGQVAEDAAPWDPLDEDYRLFLEDAELPHGFGIDEDSFLAPLGRVDVRLEQVSEFFDQVVGRALGKGYRYDHEVRRTRVLVDAEHLRRHEKRDRFDLVLFLERKTEADRRVPLLHFLVKTALDARDDLGTRHRRRVDHARPLTAERLDEYLRRNQTGGLDHFLCECYIYILVQLVITGQLLTCGVSHTSFNNRGLWVKGQLAEG